MGWGETTKGHGTGRFGFLFAIFPFPRKFLEVKYAASYLRLTVPLGGEDRTV